MRVASDGQSADKGALQEWRGGAGKVCNTRMGDEGVCSAGVSTSVRQTDTASLDAVD